MLIDFNARGLGILFVMGLIVCGVNFVLTGDSEVDTGLGFILAGAAAITLDLRHRLREETPTTADCFALRRGAYVQSMPLWIFGCLMISFGLMEPTSASREKRAGNDRVIRKTIERLTATTDQSRLVASKFEAEELADSLEECERHLERLRQARSKSSQAENERLERRFGNDLRQTVQKFEAEKERLRDLPR